MSSIDLTKTFRKLLDDELCEQKYQDFLEKNTQFIPREFIQNHGLHFDLVLRKLKFGADYVSDFFYISKSSDDWNLVFVEIEKPSSKFFRRNTNDFHSDFHSALQQISRWRAWLSDPSNLASFLSAIAPIHLPEVMRRNPAYPKYVLVHGRRSEYAGNEHRRAIVRTQERGDFKIITFDSLLEAPYQKHECYIGIRRNETIEIIGDHIVSPDIFGLIEPSHFTISEKLKEELLSGNSRGPRILRSDGTKMVDALPLVAKNIRTISR